MVTSRLLGDLKVRTSILLYSMYTNSINTSTESLA